MPKNYIKRFGEWIKLKKNIHYGGREPHFKEGEIWWGICGENVGVEINGKSTLFSRPVLVLKKLNSHFFMAIPLTSRPKSGSWYVSFNFQGKSQNAVLAQARVMSASRLYRRMGEADDMDMRVVKEGFHNLFCK